MKLWSISFAYRLGLGFHALNNEGAEGSNLMQPRRIDVGKETYDGISGEIIRHHILENFVNVCRARNISCFPLSEALHPDRGPLGIRQAAKRSGVNVLSKRNPEALYPAVRAAIASCAVLDVGGFLAPFAERPEAGADGAEQAVVAPENAIAESLADIGRRNDGGAPYTVKRDSVFDVAWLISERPQDTAITQHAAYRPSGAQSLFSQTMRSNVYGGVIRADLHRIGTDDYWYLQQDSGSKDSVSRLAVEIPEQQKRQKALIEAIVNFIASPTGAKVAGWAPHVFLTEGCVLLTSSRTAPFSSPIKVDLNDLEAPVKADPDYAKLMASLHDGNDTSAWRFDNVKSLLDALPSIANKLDGDKNGQNKSQAN